MISMGMGLPGLVVLHGRSLALQFAELYAAGGPGLWYDLPDASTMTTDTAGATPAASGQAVARLRDKSGRGLHATQSTADARGTRALAPPSLALDGVNDGYTTATFPAGTLGANMDYFVAVKRNAGGNFVLGTAVLGNAPFFAAGGSDPSTPASLGAGAPSYFVNGVEIPGGADITIEQFGAAIPVGTWCVVELHNLDLSAWTVFKFGNSYSFELNGSLGTTVMCEAQPDAVRSQIRQRLADDAGVLPPSYAVAIGDSTIAAYLGAQPVTNFLTTSRTVRNIAVPGHAIADQKAAWLATAERSRAQWVVIQVGLNDVLQGSTTASLTAQLQDLVNTVRADAPGAAVLVSQLSPMRGRLVADLGDVAGEAAYQVWLALNAAIAGGGATPITNVQGRVTAHVALLNDGAGNLLPQYDLVDDFIHTTDGGRQIVAQAWMSALTAAGVTP